VRKKEIDVAEKKDKEEQWLSIYVYICTGHHHRYSSFYKMLSSLSVKVVTMRLDQFTVGVRSAS
jgi:hypothetical protein